MVVSIFGVDVVVARVARWGSRCRMMPKFCVRDRGYRREVERRVRFMGCILAGGMCIVRDGRLSRFIMDAVTGVLSHRLRGARTED